MLPKPPNFYTLSLFFLLLFAPALGAQKTLGTGILTALVENATIVIDVSTADIYERFRYVNEGEFSRFPNRYRNFRPVDRKGRNDLRILHQEIARLKSLGWQLTASEHTLVATETEMSTRSLTEKYVFFFQVPTVRVKAEELADSVVTVIASAYEDGDPSRAKTRAFLHQNADSTYTFVVEEKAGRFFRPLLTVKNKGIAAGDLPQFLRRISINDDGISLVFAMANGVYTYDFKRSGVDYLLNGLRYENPDGCGVQDFRGNLNRGSDYTASVFYRPVECMGTEQPRSAVVPIALRRSFLSNFTPLVNRLMMDRIGQSIIY